MDDLISRQAVDKIIDDLLGNDNLQASPSVWHGFHMIKQLPSAQPEIIRCKDCKYRDENWKRVSVRWLPCMDVRTGSNWYCGSAERGEQE